MMEEEEEETATYVLSRIQVPQCARWLVWTDMTDPMVAHFHKGIHSLSRHHHLLHHFMK